MVFEQVLLRGHIGVVEEDALALYRYLEKKPNGGSAFDPAQARSCRDRR